MKKHSFLILLFVIGLFGCQQSDMNIREGITHIDVYKWASDVHVKTIKDQDLIDELVEELQSAKTHSTANMDYPLPDYELRLQTKDNTTVFEIGYYNDVIHLGVKGHYLDVAEDIMYRISIPLPIH